MDLFFNSPLLSIGSDWAYSETFAWGRDMYASLGLRLKPSGPWSISLAADGAGEHFAGRDGSNPGAGFRTAGKIEWKGKRNSLFRFNTTLRGAGPGESFDRSSSGVYYCFPAPAPAKRGAAASSGGNTLAPFPLRVSRISLNADRNASDPAKILDSLDGSIGLSLKLPSVRAPVGIALSGSIKGDASGDGTPSPYPLPQYPYSFNSAKAGTELSWSLGVFQFKTKLGYTANAKKENLWETSFSTAVRFKQGRLGLKVASLDFPDDWKCTVSWRVEKK
jgi:hypothetical protein